MEEIQMNNSNNTVDIPSLMEKELQVICKRLNDFGIESLFISLNTTMNTKICQGSEIGMEFLRQRMDITEDFYQFCCGEYDGKSGHNLISRQNQVKIKQEEENLVAVETDHDKDILKTLALQSCAHRKYSPCKICGEVLLKVSLKKHMQRKHSSRDSSSSEDDYMYDDELKGSNIVSDVNLKGDNPVNKTTSESSCSKNSLPVQTNYSESRRGDNSVFAGENSMTVSDGKEVPEIDKGKNSLEKHVRSSKKLTTGIALGRKINTRSMTRNKSELNTCDICQVKFKSHTLLNKHILQEHDQGDGVAEGSHENERSGMESEKDKEPTEISKVVPSSDIQVLCKDEIQGDKNAVILGNNVTISKKEDFNSRYHTYCKICNLKLYRRSLKRHMMRQHKDMSVESVNKTHEKEMHRLKNLNVNMTGDRVYCCRICGYKYVSVESLNYHMEEKHHMEVVKDKNVEFDTQKLHCNHCDLEFSEIDLTAHIQLVHGTDKRNEKDNEESETPNVFQIFPCNICGLDFSLQDIKTHLQMFHGHTLANSKTEEITLSIPKSSSSNLDSENTADVSLTSSSKKMKSSERVECHVCGNSVVKKSIRRHLECHGNSVVKWKYNCQDCGKGFMSIIRMKGHQRSVHKRMNLFKCQECSQTFHTLISLNKHQQKCDEQIREKSHSGKIERFSCPECLRPFQSEQSLKDHMIKHSIGNWMCTDCGLLCRNSNTLVKHRLIHQGKTSFRCSICDSMYKHAGVYSLHLKNTHKEKKYLVCKFCGDTFSLNSVLKSHIKEVHNKNAKLMPDNEKIDLKLSNNDEQLGSQVSGYICKVCNIVFDSEENLKLHSKKHKSGFMCEECGKVFLQMSGLRHHKVCHSNEKPFQCQTCSTTCKSKSHLRSHMKVHNSEYSHQCEECGKCFKRVECLKNHRKTHDEYYEYKCTQCVRQFRSSEGLKSHMLNEHTDMSDLNNYKLRYYKCEYCSKIFGAKQMYTRHVRSQHTGYKPFSCDICAATFSVRGMLNRHMKDSHLNLGKDVSCALCDVAFKGKSKYRRHLRSQKHQAALSKAGLTSEDFEKMYPVKGRSRLSEQKVEIDYLVSENELIQEELPENTECFIIQIPEGVDNFTLPIHATVSNNQQIISDNENVNAVTDLLYNV